MIVYGIAGEDEYWERHREELESLKVPYRRSNQGEDEPIHKRGNLFLDEEAGKIEAQRGCPIGELYEGDLLEIVEEQTGIVAETAAWNPKFGCIEYWHRVS